MTDEQFVEAMKTMNVNNVLVSALKHYGQLTIPVLTFLDSVGKDNEMRIDFDADENVFIFKLKEKEDNESI